MKANNGSGNNPDRDVWETPNKIWNTLNKQYLFEFDCCANKDNFKTKDYSNNFEELTKNDIKGLMCWMNPPFSKANKMFNHFFKVVDYGIAIYRFDNAETKIWQDIIFQNADWIFIPKGRVSYHLATDNANGRNGSRFPSALIGLGVDTPKYVDGICLKLKMK